MEDGYYCPPGKDKPYDLLTICVMLGLHEPDYIPPTKLVKDFFDNPSVVVFGRDMADVAKKLKNSNLIEIRNELAVRGMKRDDLDRLAMTVLGKHYDVIRPEKKLDDWWSYEGDFSFCGWRPCEEKVKIGTVDTYMCLLIGTSLVELGHSRCSVLRRRR